MNLDNKYAALANKLMTEHKYNEALNALSRMCNKEISEKMKQLVLEYKRSNNNG